MDARTALQQLRYAADELQELYETRAGVYDMLTNTTTRITPTGTRQSGDVHRLDVLGELTDRVDEQIAALAGLRVRAIGWIGALDDPLQRSVLMAYYVNCRKADGSAVTWEDVAGRLHVSLRTAMRAHAAAVGELEKLALNGTLVLW